MAGAAPSSPWICVSVQTLVASRSTQVGPHVLEAQLGHTGDGALLGGALALAGQLLAAGRLVDAPAVVQQGLQAGAQVGKAQPSGLLVEMAMAAVVDDEAAR